jgi:predicted acylesterase/phospholipase RssA
VGITVISKSDLTKVRPDAKTALVLAGGAVSGGAFKLGGLIALNCFLRNRKVTDFDMYVGVSAGALIGAALAAGVTPEELLRSLAGGSDQISQLQAWDFYLPNYKEFSAKPMKLGKDMVTFYPKILGTVARYVRRNHRKMSELLGRFLRAPTTPNLEKALDPLVREVLDTTDLPHGFSYLPSGIFDNRRLERFLRVNLRRNRMPNSFKLLKRERGKSLYISATNLNSSDHVLFGPDEDSSLTISEAVQASTALPGFFAPARINGVDYLDAAVRKTANFLVAADKGAQLIICYNPFRPFSHMPAHLLRPNFASLRDMGIVTVLDQALRTALHTRLHIALDRLRLDPSFKGDLIVIEPAATDADFFSINPLAFWKRLSAAEHGFASTKASIERHYPVLRRIFAAYGLETDLSGLRESLHRIRSAGERREDGVRDVLQSEHPARRLPSLRAV